MPSCVGFSDPDELVGEAAKINHHATRNRLISRDSVFDVKRLLGRPYADPGMWTNGYKELPFSVMNRDGKPVIMVQHGATIKKLRPEDISAILLGQMREIVSVCLKEKVTKAVITVPSHFDVAQRQATLDACDIAGLEVVQMIDDSTAIAIAYGHRDRRMKRTVLIYDMGGGTLEVSIVSIDCNTYIALATSGDQNLGGEDFTNRLVGHFSDEFKRVNSDQMLNTKSSIAKLKAACEEAKRTLGYQSDTAVEVDNLDIAKGYDGDLSLVYTAVGLKSSLGLKKFEQICDDLFTRALRPVSKVMEDAKLDKGAIDEIIMVGGGTRMKKIGAMLTEFFDGKEPNNLVKLLDTRQAVVYGAAIYATCGDGPSGPIDVNGTLSTVRMLREEDSESE